MNVVLINLPNPALAEPWSNFPLGLGYVAAAAESEGHSVQVADFGEGTDLNQLPYGDVYAMQVTAPQVEDAQDVAFGIKVVQPAAIVVAGGPQTSVDMDRFLQDPNFDSIVLEEGERAFCALLADYELFGRVKPFYHLDPIKDLDTIAFPARHLFKDFKRNALRSHHLLKGDYASGGQTTIIGSRGCPYSCSFCAPHSKRLRYRSPGNVVDELRQLTERFGIYQFKWQDDTFTLKRSWILELCRQIKENLPPTFHRSHTRVNVFDQDMAKVMRAAGFKVLCFGIESFDQGILDRNAKQVKVEQIESTFRLAKEYGFRTVGFLIFGMPGENQASVKKTMRGILRNKKYLDYLNLSTMVPLPGTPIYKDPEAFGCEIISRDLSKCWIVDHETSPDVMVRTKGVSLEQMQQLKLDMYQFMRDEGYARPEWKN